MRMVGRWLCAPGVPVWNCSEGLREQGVLLAV